MLYNCGYFSIRSCRPLPYAKLSGINPEIGTRNVDFLFHRLLVKPLSTGPLTGSHGSPLLNPCCLLSFITNSTSHGFSKASKGLFSSHSAKKLTRQVPISGLVPLSLACGSGLRDPILKEPQCENVGKQINACFKWPNLKVDLSARSGSR